MLGVRPATKGNPQSLEVMIQWKGLQSYEATWEDFEALDNRFPSFHLEDKVVLWEEGNAKNSVNHPKFTYSRKYPRGRKGNTQKVC